MSEELGYYPYLNCVEQVIIVISQCISISLYSNLLFRVVFRRRFLFCQPKSLRDLSSAIIFFMVYHVIFSVVAFPYGAYQMVEWFSVLKNTDHQPHRKVADPLFFWLGMFSTNYIYLAPIPMFFLTLDRCLLLKYQHGYNKVLRRRMLTAGINIGKYLGSFINMPFMVHAALCSIIYSKILLFGYNPSGVVLEKTAKSRSSSNKIHVSSPL
ncbi:hypothetical protein Ddc_11821 [Ditylenchus destructor]|nr:hypothetical protein Ddc_11821 [Ditylenchus destructor]